MKQFRMLLALPFIAFTSMQSAVNLSDYMTGEYVDLQGQTILHQIAQNCSDDNFEVNLRFFDFVENKLPGEMSKLNDNVRLFVDIAQSSSALALVAIALEMEEFVHKTDNNGQTALDIAKKSQHVRCQSLVSLLEPLPSEK